MQLRTIALTVASVAVLAALIVLFFQARATRDVEIPADALAGAVTQYQRAQAARSSAAAAPTRAAPRPSPARRTPPPPPEELRGGDEPERLQEPARVIGPSSAEPPAELPARMSAEAIAQRKSVRDTYIRGDYEATLELAEDMLRQDPDNIYLRRLAAMSACAVEDAGTARRHFDELGDVDRRFVAARCREHGLDL